MLHHVLEKFNPIKDDVLVKKDKTIRTKRLLEKGKKMLVHLCPKLVSQ